MQRRSRRGRGRQTSGFPLGPVLAMFAVLVAGVAVVAAGRSIQGATQAVAVGTPTPVATVGTPAPPTPGGPTLTPTAPTSAFTLQDRCVTTTLESVPGPTFIRGGGLTVEMRVGSLSEMTFASNYVTDAVCDHQLSNQEVEDLIAQLRQFPGIIVQNYTYTGG
jgi:hypothetical protein